MRSHAIARWVNDTTAVSTVEFVAIFPFFLIVVFFALQVTLALFWRQSAEEAAEIGARYAVVSDPVATGLPTTIPRKSGAVYGQACPTACDASSFPVEQASFTGSSCTSDPICNRMASVFAPISQGTVTITYAPCSAPSGPPSSCSSVDLGFAGGPLVPYVTVTVSGVPFGLGQILGTILWSGFTTVPTINVTLTGEDLSTGGAGG